MKTPAHRNTAAVPNSRSLRVGAFTVDCTGDVVAGDVIMFTEGVFTGGAFGHSRWRRSKPRHLGDRRIFAQVVSDSYGAGKQQHTFSLRVIKSDGCDPRPAGIDIRRKARNVYRNGTLRMPWGDEAARAAAADEKHQRGDSARAERDIRREREAESKPWKADRW